MLSASLRRASFARSPALSMNSLRFLSTKMATAVAEEAGIAAPIAEVLSPFEYRKKHQIVIAGAEKEYEPVKSFSESPFSPDVRKALLRQGYDTPTPIQAQSWPIILDNRDIISVARTGSGKTMGFLMPAIQRLYESKQNPEVKPRLTSSGRVRRAAAAPPTVLVLAPTRELTVQIETEAQKYNIGGITSACLYGGASKVPQMNALRNGADIVVATPGRCNDLNIMGALDLSHIKYLVLDEADRMLDMGFEPQIREIVDQLPEDRQTIFFTATWPKEVKELAKAFLINPIQINVGDNDVLNANKKIAQNIVVTNPREKLDQLFETLDKINVAKDPRKMPKTLIFAGRKADCDYLVDQLEDEKYAADSLHGDKSQAERDRVMERFRAGRTRLLVATDVAARGLDVKDIENVINYDFSNSVEDYVHRIGRTARGENSGTSYTFLTGKELANGNMMRELVGVLERCGQEIPPELLNVQRRSSSRDRLQRTSGNRYSAPTKSNRGLDAARGFSFGQSRFGAGGGSAGGFSGGNSRSIFSRDPLGEEEQQPRQSNGFERSTRSTFARSTSGSFGSQSRTGKSSRFEDYDNSPNDEDHSGRYRKGKSRDDQEDGAWEPRRPSTRRDRKYD